MRRRARLRLGIVALLLALPVSVAAAAEPAARGGSCAEPAARAFDFWIGEWDVTNRGLQRDGSWQVTGRSTARIVSVLGGCAIVEHWHGTAWGQKTIGFSVRTWNPATETWTLVLNWPGGGRPNFGELEGAFRHGRGEFFSEGTDAEGNPQRNRYSFADITPDSLRWDAARSPDGANWLTYWIMEFTRRPADAPPLYNGPWIGNTHRGCPAPEVAALDFLAGSWRGTEITDGGERAIRLEVYPILEGCALMDREWTADGEERFAVRSWVTSRERWEEVALRAGEPGFVRAAGEAGDGAAELVLQDDGADDEAAAARRIVYRRTERGLVRREERREGDGWVAVRTLELEPTFYGDRAL